MIIVAAVLFAIALIEHAGAFTSHAAWLNWQGLMLGGLLALALSGVLPLGSWRSPWRNRGGE